MVGGCKPRCPALLVSTSFTECFTAVPVAKEGKPEVKHLVRRPHVKSAVLAELPLTAGPWWGTCVPLRVMTCIPEYLNARWPSASQIPSCGLVAAEGCSNYHGFSLQKDYSHRCHLWYTSSPDITSWRVLTLIIGIGRALAGCLVESGRFVIAVGRRQENLDFFVRQYGEDKAAAFQLDISRLDDIPSFAQRSVVHSLVQYALYLESTY